MHQLFNARRHLALFLSCLGLLVLPNLVWAQLSGGSIVGQVRVSPGTELPNPVLINLESRGTVISTVYTDGEGRFGFNDLPGNIYHIKIDDESYVPANESVVIDPKTSPVRLVNIFLNPRNTGKSVSDTVTGGNPHLTSSADLKKLFPRPAIREFDAGVKADAHHKPDEAIRHYKKALQIAPDFYPACNNLGTAYLNKGSYPAAEEQFQHAIHLNSNDAAAYFNLGNLHYLTHHYAEGLNWVDQGLSKEPSSAFGHFLRGSLVSATGDFQQAQKEFQRSLDLDPNLAKAHLALVNLYLRQKRTTEAADELRAFLKILPNDPLAPKVRELLNKLQGSTAEASP
jgi:cytochrome c-type biogenesis protein CcmH/NrfG